MSAARLFKKFLAASLMPSEVGAMRTLATASTFTLIKSFGGDGLLRLDIHRHLAQVQPVQPLKEGDADTRPADEDLALLFQAGDDVRLIGGCLHIAHQKQDDDKDRDHNHRDELHNNFHGSLLIFSF